jgi:hypothetical protein
VRGEKSGTECEDAFVRGVEVCDQQVDVPLLPADRR